MVPVLGDPVKQGAQEEKSMSAAGWTPVTQSQTYTLTFTFFTPAVVNAVSFVGQNVSFAEAELTLTSGQKLKVYLYYVMMWMYYNGKSCIFMT